MTTPLQKRIFVAAALIAAAAEGAVVYKQWPSPPLRVCASAELGNLLAAANRAEVELREARATLRPGLGDGVTKDVMRQEVATASAWNDVANYKQRALEKQKAGGNAANGGACN